MFVHKKEYEVIVVGAGHAGTEAALAAARIGCQTLLLSTNLDSIGQMSCNPAIGGQAKGHIVREIDALGGEMGKATDLSGLQFRMLNTRKGPAVWAPRAQCDKKAYQFRLKWVCERQANLDIKQAQVARILHRDRVACGVETTLGVQFLSKTVIITTGTFLKGLMHIGTSQQAGGRAGESASLGLSGSLLELGLELGRLKTGTPPRLSRPSIAFSKLEAQLGDNPIPYFTHWKDELFHVEQKCDGKSPSISSAEKSPFPPGSILESIGGQLPCHLTYTTDATAEVIRANLDKSPMYSGVIEGTGPRYCPSIEDKIVKFPDKDRHQVFLEPEGIATEEIYVNGFSTCLPIDIQTQLVQTILGCENAEIMRPAYAVEYDFAFPTQLQPSLETKCCHNIFLAGQINGTSGYEEAAAQGIIAGINAAQKVLGREPLVLKRSQAYIGVLIDDLISLGTTEPYRMFTSRAEHRLLLRQDNADQRLSEIGFQLGLLPATCFKRFQVKEAQIRAELHRLDTTYHGSNSLANLLRKPEMNYRALPKCNESLPEEVTQEIEIMVKYSGYIDRQELEVNKSKSFEDKMIPISFDYNSIPSLRTEARQKLIRLRPTTLGHAAKISGVSPADISLVLVYMKREPTSGIVNI